MEIRARAIRVDATCPTHYTVITDRVSRSLFAQQLDWKKKLLDLIIVLDVRRRSGPFLFAFPPLEALQSSRFGFFGVFVLHFRVKWKALRVCILMRNNDDNNNNSNGILILLFRLVIIGSKMEAHFTGW